MNAYLVIRANEDLANFVIRADDEDEARGLADLAPGEKVTRMADDVAEALKVPNEKGRHEGVLTYGITLLGEPLSK